MPRDGTYPPLDRPKPVADGPLDGPLDGPWGGLWVVDSGPHRMFGLPIPLRMTVVRLADGGLWLHSPTRHTPELAAALAALGPVRHLVAPDTVHWLHAASWQAAVPEAKLWTAPGVAARAAKRGTTLRPAGDLGAVPPPDWEGQFAQALFEAPGFVEVAFHHHASRSLILTDVVQAMEPDRLSWLPALLVRALGAAGPEGGTPRHLRLLLNRRRAANQAAARTLLALAPERVLFTHGAWYAERGAERLRRAWGWLLD